MATDAGKLYGDRKTIGVILFQLGGPDSLETIEPFLYNLFCDPDIIDFPLAKVGRPILARLIARARARKLREHYARIGGRSPIRELTERQAAALEQELRRTTDARVFVAMRYWHPLTEEALERARQAECDDLILLPLYPQYSSATTGSSFKEWQRRCEQARLQRPTIRIRQYYDFTPYLDSLVEQINGTLKRFGQPKRAHLVFSAHNVPASIIQAGDPYQAQIEETVRLVRKRGRWPNPATICYQSKVGNQKWLQPTLRQTIRRLADQGTKAMLVVPIAFVSDHVETLSEIDIEARQQALEHGFSQFELMPGLNDDPAFIRALALLVLKAIGEQQFPAGDRAGAAAS